MKTRSIKKEEVQDIKWYIVDAKGGRLGNLASKVSNILLEKDNVKSISYQSPRNKVVVINTSKMDIPQKKQKTKMYYSHSGYTGNLKVKPLEEMFKERPNRVFEKAVKGMMPKTKMQDKYMKNLYLYEDEDYKQSQNELIKIKL